MMQMRREEFVVRIQDEYKDVSFFLDSGAFTYWAKWQHESDRLTHWRTYKQRYFTYVDETWERWCRVAELDLDGAFNGEIDLYRLADWREEMFDRWPTAPITPVWHPERGPEEWTSYCRDDRIKHLAIGSGVANIGMTRRLIYEAHQRNKLVHGFGMTHVATALPHLPYDSVDSVVGSAMVWLRAPNGKKTEVRPIREVYQEWQNGRYRGWQTLTSERGPAWYETVWASLQGVVQHTVQKRIAVITLEGGRKVRVTCDHALFRMTSQGELQSVSAEDVAEGDFVATVRAPKWGGGGLQTKCVYIHAKQKGRKSIDKSKWFSTRVELTDDFLMLCGLWIADGSYGSYGAVQISAVTDAACRSLCRRVARQYGRRLRISGNGVDGRIHSIKLARRMRALGMVGHSHTKRLPDWFWSLSREQACMFLRGYFSGEGSGSGSPSASTVSKMLWKQLLEALPALTEELVSSYWAPNEGKSSFDGPCRPSGHVTFTSARAKRAFLHHIGFLQARKRAAVVLDDDRERYSDGVPAAYSARVLRRPNTGWAIPVHAERVPRNTDPGAFVSHVLSPDLVYLRVRSVKWLKEKQRKVYDLSVPGTEKFVADGVLVHNSSSWVMGQKFGTLFIFSGNKFRRIGKDQKGVRKHYRAHFKRLGIDWRAIEQDEIAEVRKANIIAWRDFGNRLAYLRTLQKKTLAEDVPNGFNEQFPTDLAKLRDDGHTHEYARLRGNAEVGSALMQRDGLPRSEVKGRTDDQTALWSTRGRDSDADREPDPERAARGRPGGDAGGRDALPRGDGSDTPRKAPKERT